MNLKVNDLKLGAEWLQGLLDDYEQDPEICEQIGNCVAFLDTTISAMSEGKREVAI